MSAPLQLLAAVIVAPATQVAEVLQACRPEDVQLVDAPTATALDVAAILAGAGKNPTAELLNAELLRSGLFDGHAGELVKARLLDAASPAGLPELLPELAAAVLAQVFRARLAAAGEALTAGAAAAPESDLWELLRREGTRARDLLGRLDRLRGERVAR